MVPMAHFVGSLVLLFILLPALPDGTEAEVDLRPYKNTENETKLMTGNKLAAGYFFFNIHVAKHMLITRCMLENIGRSWEVCPVFIHQTVMFFLTFYK